MSDKVQILDNLGNFVANGLADLYVEPGKARLSTWHGLIQLIGSHRIDLTTNDYKIRLSDGRTARIVVTAFNLRSIKFDGVGPFDDVK
jgi:hypothetical protein